MNGINDVKGMGSTFDPPRASVQRCRSLGAPEGRHAPCSGKLLGGVRGRGGNRGIGRHLCGVWEELLVLLFEEKTQNGIVGLSTTMSSFAGKNAKRYLFFSFFLHTLGKK